MFLKLLGLFDLFTAVVILLVHFDVVTGWRFPLFFVAYLLFKVVLFHDDIASFFDILVAGYLVLAIFGFHLLLLTVVAVVYLLQKAVMCFL